MSKSLEMVFKNSQDKSVRFNIVDIKEGLTAAEVKAVMDNIIAENLFMPNNLELVEIESATVVTVSREALELA